jgi:predicted nucleic acid-binding protein
MQVVDTHIVVNLLMEGPFSASARALHARDPGWQSEPLLLIELTNVMATVVRKLDYTLANATAILHNAQQIMAPGLRRVADHDALNAAAHFGVTGYDARFLVVARATGTRLVTEDAKLRRAAPELTCSLAEALVAAGLSQPPALGGNPT